MSNDVSVKAGCHFEPREARERMKVIGEDIFCTKLLSFLVAVQDFRHRIWESLNHSQLRRRGIFIPVAPIGQPIAVFQNHWARITLVFFLFPTLFHRHVNITFHSFNPE